MRKFRFIGDPEEYDNLFEKNKVYAGTFIPKESHNNVSTCAFSFPDDWEEFFDEPKKLHKDTDLGYFSGLALQAILVNAESYEDSYLQVDRAIRKAKELIKQLDEEQ